MVVILFPTGLKFNFHMSEVFFGYLMHGWAMILLLTAAASADALLRLNRPFSRGFFCFFAA